MHAIQELNKRLTRTIRSMKKYFPILFAVISLTATSRGQNLPSVTVDVNLDVKHITGSVGDFDRNKFITIHSTQTDHDWTGELDKMDYTMNQLDVYFGRNTGSITWDFNQVAEDQARPGYPNYINMVARGQQSRDNYASKTDRHPYEPRSDIMVCAQNYPYWPGARPTNPCCGGTPWYLANAAATAEFMGNWINLYRGGNGQPRPRFIEVMNEPLWELVRTEKIATPLEVFEYHNDIADGIRALNQDVQIGGFVHAFPDFEDDDFHGWENHWKLFMDVAGDNMDFFSIHMYDVHHAGGVKKYLKGSNIEATFDMLEHYSKLSFDTVKPFVVSEFGAATPHLYSEPWTPYRDWLNLNSYSALMMSFLERPDKMLKVIPFIMLKADWGRTTVPYTHRLMRQAFEAEGETGTDWVFTDMIKFYELWSAVKGTRIDTYPTDADIQVDAYVDGSKAYIILNNLEFKARTIGLNLSGLTGLLVLGVTEKHLYLSGTKPRLEITEHTGSPMSVTVEAEATTILECSFSDTLDIADSSTEVKYYADEYYQPISSGSPQLFHINGVGKGTDGGAILRLGLGRDHGRSLQPVVLFNDSALTVPEDLRGDDQVHQDRFFGLLEIAVPYALLKDSNTVSVTFGDDGGHISSLTLQAFEFSKSLARSVRPTVFNANFRILDNDDDSPIEGAEVVFAGRTVYSDNEGYARFDSVGQGTYSFSASSTEYIPYTVDSLNFTDNINLVLKLEPVEYQVTFQVNEADLNIPVISANVTTGGKSVVSDAGGQAKMDLRYGTYVYRIEKPYFETLTDSFSLGTDTLLHIAFRRLLADLKFRVKRSDDNSRVPDAMVTVADSSIATNALGMATFEALKVDTVYPYTISRQGFSLYTDSFRLKQDSTIEVHLVITAIGQHEMPGGISLYPNPVSNELSIDLVLEETLKLEFIVSDFTGRTIINIQEPGIPGENHFSLPMEILEEGMYLVTIKRGNSSFSYEILKKNKHPVP